MLCDDPLCFGEDLAWKTAVLGVRGSRVSTAVSRTFMTSVLGVGRVPFFFATFLPAFLSNLSGMATRVLRVLLTRKRIRTRLVLENSGNY
jgi:hypothetical protein